MKILFGTYPWAFDTPGGGERQLIAYQYHLKSCGINVNLFNQWKPKLKNNLLFHFFSVMPGSLQLLDHIKKQGIPVVISPNLWVTPATRDQYPHKDIASLLPVADVIVVNSNMEADSLSEVYNLPRERFKTVYNGVEEDFTKTVEPEMFRKKFNINSRFILNVANIEPRKNQLNFLKALKSFPDITLINIGHIRDNLYANECIKESGSQFHHLGPFPYNSPLIRSALAGCDFFAMPSTLETPSIAALEAYASGVPLLITKEGSTTEYFGNSAHYIEPCSISSMKEGIANALLSNHTNILDTKFLWKNVILDLANVYKDLIQ